MSATPASEGVVSRRGHADEVSPRGHADQVSRRGHADQVQRLFVAVDPPDGAVAHLAAVVDDLEVSRANAPGRSTRLAPHDRWHVTLAFLGDVPVRRVGKAARAVDLAVAALVRVRGSAPPPEVCFAGGGTFGRGPSTILWVGLGGDLPTLRQLAEAVRQQMRRAHLPFDEKAFRPHLTIARPGERLEPDLVAVDVATLDSYTGPPWSVSCAHLYASDMVTTPSGPQPHYTRLASIPLPDLSA